MRRFTPINRTTIALVASLAVACTALCGIGSASAAIDTKLVSAKPLVKVSLTSFTANFASLPTYVATEKNYFTANGIDPSIVNVASGTAALQALLSGSVNMANVAVFEVLAAAAKGQSVKYIVGATTGPIGEIVVGSKVKLANESKGYPDAIRALKGKKIGVSALGSSSYYYLTAILKAAGLNPSTDVTIVAGGTESELIASLQAGQVDAFFSQEPGTTEVVSSGVGKTIFVSYKGNRPKAISQQMTNGIATTGSYIASNPAAVKGVHDAIAEADLYISSLTPAGASSLATSLASDFPGITHQVLTTAIENYHSSYSPVVKPVAVSAANALLISNGVLKTAVAPNTVIAPSATTR
jgi:NitT/TauT family transport system substrate-binding protein